MYDISRHWVGCWTESVGVLALISRAIPLLREGYFGRQNSWDVVHRTLVDYRQMHAVILSGVSA
jgi:hypothetical protein